MNQDLRLLTLFLGICITLLSTSSQSSAQVNRRLPIKNARVNVPSVSRRPPVRRPFPPLRKAQQDYIDQILNFWEKSSNRIKTYSCEFTRWEYSPFVKNNAATQAFGEIKFSKPDKGLYRVNTIGKYVPPQNANGAPSYPQKPGYEHWVCDGKTVFEFNYLQKQLLEYPLPADLQGKAIQNGPLPFLFGAKKDDLKNRYWIRWVPPPGGIKTGVNPTEYWIEAYPKHKQDQANYEKLVVVLDQKDFLPNKLQIILPGGKDKKSFVFNKRKKNDRFAIFQKDFSKPKLPTGWKRVEQNPPRPGSEPQGAPRNLNAQIPRR